MSLSREVGIEWANKEVIEAGARAYGVPITDKTIQLGGMEFELKSNGQIKGDFAGVSNLGNTPLTEKGDAHGTGVGEEIVGRLVRAGSIVQNARFLEKNQYNVQSDPIQGTLTAHRGDERLTVSAKLDGTVKFDAEGYQGNSCSLTVDQLQKELGKVAILRHEDKVDPQTVIRTQI